MQERGGLAGAGPLERPVLCLAQAPRGTDVSEGHRLTPAVSVWLGLCSAAALPDPRPAPAHGSRWALLSLPGPLSAAAARTPVPGVRTLRTLSWPGLAPPLPSFWPKGNRGQTGARRALLPLKVRAGLNAGRGAAAQHRTEAPTERPFRARGSVHTEGSAFPWPAPAGLTGTHQGPALATRKQRDFPWRRLGSALSAWAACWHHGRAVGVGGGSQAPWQFQDTRTSSAPSRAQA